MPPDAFIRIIRSCSLSLINASFSVELDSRWVARQPKYIASIVMPSLTELDLRLIDLSWDPLFPLVLQLPVLQKFSIGEADRNFPLKWNLHVYGALALRSARTLKTFRLVDLEINTETKLPVNVIPGTYHHRSTPPRLSSHFELEEFLRAFPLIENLALPLSLYIHYTTLEKVAMGTLLPVLETLEIGTGTYTDASAVLAMVRKRNPAQSSSTSPWVPSPFSFLTLILPTMTAQMQAQVTQAAHSLGLESGCHLWFIPRCKSWKDHQKQEVCGRHCFFPYTTS
ncbi:hypothetical protein CPB84DRAFT_1790064 [Gymnopilus junonius]|uniref:Uncharacterized protein n=1 Tax=Gymnopilus junonius TaxID=109634 RepID=A0A9P5TJF4_GYMJU|nr:hypothetical protein CPB84DRAFT_1790064 [Gymnopilus junonius]